MLWFLRIRRLFRATGREALILWYAFRHPATPGTIKLASVLMLAYLISPIDLLPDFALLLGWADDLALLMLGIPFLVGKLPVDVMADASEKADRRLGRFRAQEATSR